MDEAALCAPTHQDMSRYTVVCKQRGAKCALGNHLGTNARCVLGYGQTVRAGTHEKLMPMVLSRGGAVGGLGTSPHQESPYHLNFVPCP